MTKTIKDRKQFYWLVAGNVVIGDGDTVQSIMQNAMLTTDTKQIGVHQLGKAQQALQVMLFKKLDATVNVVDVIILNISCLGLMTEAEFNARPEGVAVQERPAVPAPSAEIIDFTKELADRG